MKEFLLSSEKKFQLVQQAYQADSQYRMYVQFMKVFRVLLWAGPLFFIVVKLLRFLLRGSGPKGYEISATLINCLLIVVSCMLFVSLLPMVVRIYRGDFTQDNREESIVITPDETIIYSYLTPNGKQQEMTIRPKEMMIDENLRRCYLEGSISLKELGKGNVQIPKRYKSFVILYDYYTPSLIEEMKTKSYYGG